VVNLGQRSLKVLGNLGEAPLYRACPSDQDIIVAWNGMRRTDDADGFLQPPARLVAIDRAAQCFVCGKAEAGEFGFGAFFICTRARLQHKRGRSEAQSFSHMEKLGTGLETSDCRHRGGG